jgi:hypothetical protein
MKSGDLDQNAINDFWTADVAGLYYMARAGTSEYVRLVELPLALADANTRQSGTTYAMPATHASSPKSGYWIQAHTGWEEPAAQPNTYGNQNTDRISFVAYPNSYGSGGKLIFIVSEAGTMYKMDPGGAITRTAPATGVNDTNGILQQNPPAYHLFPYDVSNAAGPVGGPWSKMD